MIVGFCGLAGSGKDTCADLLVEVGYAKVSFADPLKRIAKEIFAFTDEQLWGPSHKRNEPDLRYPRHPYGSSAVTEYLTPRYALQRLGTEWGRDCYEPIWCDYALRIARKLEENGEARYDARRGLWYAEDRRDSADREDEVVGVAIPDVRFGNEVAAIKTAGGKVIRVVRPGAGLSGGAALHPSEVEQAAIPDEAFDLVLVNDGTLEDLERKLYMAMTDSIDPAPMSGD